MASVSLRKVRKVYPGGAVGVDGIDLEIRDGEFVVLVGPSGCGKSTTLRMVAGLEEISSGEISIGGRVVNEVLPKDRDIAMVFQNYALYPHMTVRENLAFGLKLRKVPKDEIERRIAEAAAVLGIEPYLDRRPKALSGGQRQRVAVGRAIVRNPAVFLFDEPLSNLDAKMRTQMRVEIKRLHARLGATMIYVTHDQTEAMTMGDRIVVMEGGRIRQAGAPLEVYGHPADRFVAGFIGTPPMNFFEGRVERDAGGAPAFRFGAAILPLPDAWRDRVAPLSDGPATLGVRPEAVAPAADGAAGAAIDAEVDVVEPMGAETYVYAAAAGASFIARVPSGAPVRAGTRARFLLDLSRASLFGPDGNSVL